MGDRQDKVAAMMAEELMLAEARANGTPSVPPVATLARELNVKVDAFREKAAPVRRSSKMREVVVRSRDPRRESTNPPPPGDHACAAPTGAGAGQRR